VEGGHYGQSGAGYFNLFDPDFQTAHLERETDCFVYIYFLDQVPSASQIKKDTRRALYDALLSAFACQGGCRILPSLIESTADNRSLSLLGTMNAYLVPRSLIVVSIATLPSASAMSLLPHNTTIM
jgi:hypothetical protein